MAKNVNIKIKADSKEAESGIKQVTSDLNKLQKSIKTSDVAKFGKAFTGVGLAVAGTVTAIKKVNAAVKETTEAYRTQIKAETQLETAAKNNPYLNSSSVQSLKDYASYLQSISTYGDETLIPLMAQLASAGRTQAEIQDIMAASLDVAASGFMSLETAVTSLNKTYSGSVGLIGNQIDGLKTLTAEQLKNGDAVKIVADRFKGMAEETAKASGSTEQLKNAIGDMKEEIGASFEKNMAPMRRFFTELVTGWTNAKKAKREYLEAKGKTENGTASVNDYEKTLAEEKKQLELYKTEVESTMALLNDEEALQKKIQETRGATSKTTYQNLLTSQQKRYEQQQLLVDQLEAELEVTKANEEAQAAKTEAEKKAAEAKAEQNEKNAKALKIMQDNEAALNKELEQMRIRAELEGVEVDKQEELNAMMESYVKLITTSSLVTENNPYAKKRFEEIKAFADSLAVVVEETQEETSSVEETKSAWEKFLEVLDGIGALSENLSTLQDFVDQVSDITTNTVSLVRQSMEAETNTMLSELSKQYTDGILSYEEYCNKKKEIEKQAAKEEYKLKMWEWTASMTQATANIAQGVSAALAGTPPSSYVMAALTAAAGAVQLATLTANKPKAPSFATGGVIGGMSGASMGGDNTYIHARQGEMLLNAAQQAQLWKMANGSNTGATSVNMPVTIENNNGSNVQTQLSSNGLRIVVDNMVNSSMSAGRYTQSMNIAQSKQNGGRVL